MARSVAIVILLMLAWSGAIAVLYIATTAGSVSPCPEARPVGLSEDELAEILRMCAQRAPADWARPAVGILLWLAGMISLAALGARRYRVHMPNTKI